MCCRRNQPQQLHQTQVPVQTRQLSKCAARRQERRELRALAVNSLPDLEKGQGAGQTSSHYYWTEYQPRTMAGILVMGVALGMQEGGRKIKEKRNERKAKKVALAAEAYAPAESSSCKSGRGSLTRTMPWTGRKSDEARREQQQRGSSTESIHGEDAPPSYDEVARPTYEEATRDDQRTV